MPVDVRVNFNAPPSTTVRLYDGPALRAYYKWLEHPSWENEEALAEYIWNHCEDHVLAWTTLAEWDPQPV